MKSVYELKFGVVIDLLCSLYCTHDFSDPERHWLHIRAESEECVTRFCSWFKKVRNEVTNSLLSRFCLISEEFILKHRQSMGFCQHDGPCFTPIQNNR